MRLLRCLAFVCLAALAHGAWAANDAVPPADAASAPPPVSLSARKVYEQARSQLLQIRTVLKGRASQTSVGSGFIVSKEGHIVTNFHVVSEVALEPTTHDLVYVTADGREAPLQILMLDVLHDLALLKIAPAKDAPATFDALAFRPARQTLGQGERMYSLGKRLSAGASHERIMYSWSSRCIRNGTHARPLSTQTCLSLGNRSGNPLMIQLVMWIRL